MKIKKIISAREIKFILILLLGSLASCIEEYWPNISASDNKILVVDGMITNDPGPYTVKLSTSSSIEDHTFNPVTDAIVQIIDNDGSSETLSEVNPGIYETSETGIQGVVGRSYKIIINTNEGKNYESEFEKLPLPIEIESVTTEIENQTTTNISDIFSEGFQFYLSTVQAITNTNYFYWALEETYEYHSEFYADYVLNQNKNGEIYFRALPPDSLFCCYLTKKIDNIYTASTAYINNPKIDHVKLSFLPYESKEAKFGYGLYVKQYVISESTYLYLNSIKDQKNDQDELYTKQPYQIRGNVNNVENPDEPVFGYFIIAGAAQGKHTFVKAPPNTNHFQYSICEIEGQYFGMDIKKLYEHQRLPPLPLYFEFVNYPFLGVPFDVNNAIFIVPNSQECIDCTFKGGVLKKPDYWDQ